ncbi:MAG: hypothetical protein WC222_10635 [Parachlamydiales bacterium]|jgi:hypothetical protein
MTVINSAHPVTHTQNILWGIDVLRRKVTKHKEEIAFALLSAGAYLYREEFSETYRQSVEAYPVLSYGLSFGIPLFTGILGCWVAKVKMPFLTIYESRLVGKFNSEFETYGYATNGTWEEACKYASNNTQFAQRLRKFINSSASDQCYFELIVTLKILILHSYDISEHYSDALLNSYRGANGLLRLRYDPQSDELAEKKKLSFDECCRLIYFSKLYCELSFDAHNNGYAINDEKIIACKSISGYLNDIAMDASKIPTGSILIPNLQHYQTYRTVIGKGDFEHKFDARVSLKFNSKTAEHCRIYYDHKVISDDRISRPSQYLIYDIYELDLDLLINVQEYYQDLMDIIGSNFREELEVLLINKVNITCASFLRLDPGCKTDLGFVARVIDVAIDSLNDDLSQKDAILEWENSHSENEAWNGCYTLVEYIWSPFNLSMNFDELTPEVISAMRGFKKCQAHFGKLEGHLNF